MEREGGEGGREREEKRGREGKGMERRGGGSKRKRGGEGVGVRGRVRGRVYKKCICPNLNTYLFYP